MLFLPQDLKNITLLPIVFWPLILLGKASVSTGYSSIGNSAYCFILEFCTFIIMHISVDISFLTNFAQYVLCSFCVRFYFILFSSSSGKLSANFPENNISLTIS